MATRRRARRRPLRPPLRWLAVGALVVVALLYYRPLRSYLETRAIVAKRTAEVRELRAQRQRLEARLARSTSMEALARDARRLGFVKPGERLYIVKGIREWRVIRGPHDR